jgi:tetratricopeptide (TPR) repeat protein
MASPSGVEQPFNWARVLKHEVVHVITLQQTNFNIPHWYTEALAVTAEGYPRPQVWNELLARRVPAGNLFTLDNINLAFARPQTQLDWQMAYCQSELYADYMQQRFGPESTARLLDAYRDGLSTGEAIPKVFETSLAEFEAGYVEHLRSVAANLKIGPVEPAMSRAELEQAVAAEPTNADLAARLGYEYLKQRKYPKARELALKATSLEKNHPLGSYLLARLHLLVGDTERARDVLEPALNPDNPDPRLLELTGDLLIRAKEHDKASSLYELGQKFFPNDRKWVAGVARVALITDNRSTLRSALERLSELDADDPSPRKKLAQLAAEDKDWAAAARYAWMTLHINVTDLDAHTILAEAMSEQQRWAEAADEYRVISELRPTDLSVRLKLAKALNDAGNRQAAIKVLDELVSKDPNNTEARELLDQLHR